MARILLAEDEEILRMLVADTLEEEGYSLEEAADGEEALKKMLEHEYDLILLDYMMPGYTGLELIEKIRNHPDKKNAKIMMLSAKSQAADQERVLDAGADYFMAKPFSPIQLLEKIKEITGQDE
ncbi:response regulator [Metabacillus sp. GX 13764]|uniref:response regulator transcription factor n=1 Tax=Metabacillus kandeliae TaxID=2900151 RepID=UPI001E49F1D1|nr:response regulator [Metabacillus kandeliae]MCD7035772.1 response regulator [Metabacillus kandeliae]